MSQVEVWRLLAGSELAAIQDGLAQRLEGWRQDCLGASAGMSMDMSTGRGTSKTAALRCTAHAALAGDAHTGHEDSRLGLLDSTGRVLAHLDWDQAWLDWLQEETGLAPASHDSTAKPSGLARHTCLALLRALLAQLAGLPEQSASQAHLFSGAAARFPMRKGCGAVRLEITTNAQAHAPRLSVVLSHSLVAQWCQPRPVARGALASRQGLADRLKLRYRVLAGSVELPLSTLAQLQAGDVLRLDTRADQGLLLVAQDQPLCRAGLGLRAGQAALQVCAD